MGKLLNYSINYALGSSKNDNCLVLSDALYRGDRAVRPALAQCSINLRSTTGGIQHSNQRRIFPHADWLMEGSGLTHRRKLS